MEPVSFEVFLDVLHVAKSWDLEMSENGIVLVVNIAGAIRRLLSPNPKDVNSADWEMFIRRIGEVLEKKEIINRPEVSSK
jgi:hypothetical protein